MLWCSSKQHQKIISIIDLLYRENQISSVGIPCIHSNRRGYPSFEGAHIAISKFSLYSRPIWHTKSACLLRFILLWNNLFVFSTLFRNCAAISGEVRRHCWCCDTRSYRGRWGEVIWMLFTRARSFGNTRCICHVPGGGREKFFVDTCYHNQTTKNEQSKLRSVTGKTLRQQLQTTFSFRKCTNHWCRCIIRGVRVRKILQRTTCRMMSAMRTASLW